MSPDTLAVVVRAMLFIALFQAVGATLFAATFAGALRCRPERIRSHARTVAVIAMILVIVHLVLQVSRMSGSFRGLADFSLYGVVLASPIGTAHVLQWAGLALVAVGIGSANLMARGLAAAGAVATLAAFLLVGHTAGLASQPLPGLLLLAHLLVVAFWFGSLWPLRELVRREPRQIAGQILRRFSLVATWLVPLIAVAGVVLALLVASGIPDVQRPYTRLLLGKVTGFVLLMGIASWNKWRLVPALERGEARTGSRLEASLSVERLLIALVLAVTAVMTSLHSPHD